MKCDNCGKDIPNNSGFCSFCGNPVESKPGADMNLVTNSRTSSNMIFRHSNKEARKVYKRRFLRRLLFSVALFICPVLALFLLALIFRLLKLSYMLSSSLGSLFTAIVGLAIVVSSLLFFYSLCWYFSKVTMQSNAHIDVANDEISYTYYEYAGRGRSPREYTCLVRGITEVSENQDSIIICGEIAKERVSEVITADIGSLSELIIPRVFDNIDYFITFAKSKIGIPPQIEAEANLLSSKESSILEVEKKTKVVKSGKPYGYVSNTSNGSIGLLLGLIPADLLFIFIAISSISDSYSDSLSASNCIRGFIVAIVITYSIVFDIRKLRQFNRMDFLDDTINISWASFKSSTKLKVNSSQINEVKISIVGQGYLVQVISNRASCRFNFKAVQIKHVSDCFAYFCSQNNVKFESVVK